jgi:hypothetical protein
MRTTRRPAEIPVAASFRVEPPWGIEPQTYALREARRATLSTLPAQIAALVSRNALGARRAPIPVPRPGPRPGQPSGNNVLLAFAVFRDGGQGGLPARLSGRHLEQGGVQIVCFALAAGDTPGRISTRGPGPGCQLPSGLT